MRFKNLKASDLSGRVDLPGLTQFVEGLSGNEASLLITAPAGTGKTAAVAAIARKLGREDVMQCDLLQVFEYPDVPEALRSILTIVENLRATLFQAEGIDRLVERLHKAGMAEPIDEMRIWLETKGDLLRSRKVCLVATGRKAESLPEELRGAFGKAFTGNA